MISSSSLITGIVIFLMGVVLWKTKAMRFISGKNSKADHEGLANWVGKNTMIIGGLVLVSAALQFLILGQNYPLVGLIIIIILSMRMSSGMTKYQKAGAKSGNNSGKGKKSNK